MLHLFDFIPASWVAALDNRCLAEAKLRASLAKERLGVGRCLRHSFDTRPKPVSVPNGTERKAAKTIFAMFQKGQKVVCIDDQFPREVHTVYAQLPKKDSVYTVRAVYIGRGKMLNAGHVKGLSNKPGDSDGEIGILVEELRNPADMFNLHGQELGFNAERFRTMEEISEDVVHHEPAELVAH